VTRRSALMAYIMGIWFVISFVTNLIGPLMPVIIKDYGLNLTLAGVLPFSFFIAYGIVSIPAGSMVEARGPRWALAVAFSVNLVGCAAIAVYPQYLVVVGGLFLIGAGMAMLQVVINPLMRATGGDVHFAFFSVMGQLVFGLASFVSPLVFEALMGADGTAARPLVWVVFYQAFTLLFILLAATATRLPLAPLQLNDDERPGTAQTYRRLIARRDVQLFFLGIVAYVGTEQSLANWMSQFLATYHGFDPAREGAQSVGGFWGLMSLGCVVGLLLLRLFDSKIVLAIFTVGAFACFSAALWGPREVSLLAFPWCGFFLSVMFSILFSLGLNSVPDSHGALSGILCTGILGGAVVPLLVGVLGDRLGLRAAMCTVYLTLAYVLGTVAWARPLVRNQTVPWRQLLRRGPSAKIQAPPA